MSGAWTALTPAVAQAHLAHAGGDLRTADTVLAERVDEAMRVVDSTLDTYGLTHTALTFNGGKDSTVLLHLLALALHRRGVGVGSDGLRDAGGAPFPGSTGLGGMRVFFFRRPEDVAFAEVDALMAVVAAAYRLQPLVVTARDMKEGLARVTDATGVRAMLAGTRGTDPHSARLSHQSPTDAHKGWPAFMRVNPILRWSHGEVWRFIRTFDVPFCSLYAHGYTSLGTSGDTLPNPHLRRPERAGDACDCAPRDSCDAVCDAYRPAWELENDDWERAGRL